MTKVVYFFKNDKKDKYSVFSNWYPSPFIDDNKVRYWCCEQYIMAKKAELFNDKNTLLEIMKSNSQVQIKALGRRVCKFDEKTWEGKRENIAYICTKLKFSQNESLKEILLSTKKKLIAEANPNDLVWSIGITEKESEKGKKWRGLNLLGNTLVRVRDELQSRE